MGRWGMGDGDVKFRSPSSALRPFAFCLLPSAFCLFPSTFLSEYATQPRLVLPVDREFAGNDLSDPYGS
jgi:hypothetical protein